MYLVAIDTRGLPATDLQEGFEELACSRDYFIEHIVRDPHTKRVNCPLAEVCGLGRGFYMYFQEYIPGHGAWLPPNDDDEAITDDQDLQNAWNEYFPLGQNNPAATLLTFDPTNGCARFNVQGIAHVLYDEGNYPLSKEQVWGLCELANEAKDMYFCNDFFHEKKAKYQLARWCGQYKRRGWGPSSIYEPRNLDGGRGGHLTRFHETCLI